MELQEAKIIRKEIESNISRLRIIRDEIERNKKSLLNDRKSQLQIVDLIPKTNIVINTLYDSIAGKMVKACEGAITDASHEIIGDKTNIGMDVYTRNGQIAVDIGSAIHTDENNRILRSIVDGEGGGLTNVVCFSLRAIITSRSGQRKFMVIDEPDCWLDNGKIDPFFNVICKMATDGGYQIIALTHHDTTNFEDRANILTIEKEGKNPATLTVSGQPDDSLSRDNIIESIRLENFGGHADLFFPLAPGLNFIRGSSNVGKSRLLRALRCVILNEGNDGDISSFPIKSDNHIIYDVAKNCSVEITFDGGKKIIWTRKKSGSPKESWSYLDEQGHPVILSDGTKCLHDRNGKDWAGSSEALNIKPYENGSSKLCAQLHTQKLPMFAINESGNVLASLLSIGEDAGLLRQMLHVSKQKDSEAKSVIKQIDKNLTTIDAELLSISKLSVLEKIHTNLLASEQEIEEYDETISRIDKLFQEYQACVREKEINTQFINSIPEAPTLIDTEKLENLFVEYIEEEAFIERFDHFVGLLSQIPVLKDYSSIPKVEQLFETYIDISNDTILIDNFTKLCDSIPEPPNQDLHSVCSVYNEYQEIKKEVSCIEKFIKLIPDRPELNENIHKIDQLINDYNEQWDILDTEEAREEDINMRLVEIKSIISQLQETMNICPTCGQTIEHKH